MQLSSIHLRQRLVDQLLALPGIVNRLEAKRPESVAELLQWSASAENVLLEHRMPLAAELASVRARIVAAKDNDQLAGSNGRVRQRLVTLSLVGELQAPLQAIIASIDSRSESARGPLRRLLQVIANGRAIRLAEPPDMELLVEQIWTLAQQHEQLKPLVIEVRTFLSDQDARLLTLEELEPADFVSQPEPA